jgi:hypothetical protein
MNYTVWSCVKCHFESVLNGHFVLHHFAEYHFAEYHFAEYHFAEYHFAEYHFASQKLILIATMNAILL